MTIIRAKLQTTDFLFLCRSSLLLSEICQNIHMKFDAQIAENGVSGSIYFKNFPGGAMPPDPPSRSHAFGARFHDHLHDAGFATATPLPVTSGMPQGFIRYLAQHRFYCAKIIFPNSNHDCNVRCMLTQIFLRKSTLNRCLINAGRSYQLWNLFEIKNASTYFSTAK